MSGLSAESLALLARLRKQTGRWVLVSQEDYSRLPLLEAAGIYVQGRVRSGAAGPPGQRAIRLP